MTFVSLDYLIFFVLVVGVYWLLSHRGQNMFLVAASFVFYGWVHPWFVGLMLCSLSIDYVSARVMEKNRRYAKTWLLLSLSANLGLLAVFKYFDFFVESFQTVLTAMGLPSFGRSLGLILPVGISFYTFQTMGYVLDVYRGRTRAISSVVDFAGFISFFPQLVAGPIERAPDLLPQVQSPRTFSPEEARSGILLMLWGFFKKMAIADNVALTADRIFALRDPSFWLLWCGVFAFTIQIFADFSGYTDIARGSARLLGFRLQRNFFHPYLATSPSDFWRRWHVSLSSWVRDYLYIPLGGNRGGLFRSMVVVMITFALVGLWHGASWNFVIWGLYHGSWVLVFRGARHFGRWPGKVAGRVVTFLIVVFGWYLFREQDLNYLWRHLQLSPWENPPQHLATARYLFALTFLYSVPLWIHPAGERAMAKFSWPAKFEIIVQPVLGVALVCGIYLFASAVTADFIYFQF